MILCTNPSPSYNGSYGSTLSPDRQTDRRTDEHTDTRTHAHTHTYPFNGPLSGTTRVSRYQKGKTNLDFTGARNSEWQWHQLGMCKSAPRTRQITTPAPHHSVLLQAGCPSCHQTNSVKALKAKCGLITAKEINTLST